VPHDILDIVTRRQKRFLLEAEAKARKSGSWGTWERIDLVGGFPGRTGWCAKCVAVHRNQVFLVLERPLADGTRHLAVTSLSQTRPTWWEMQRIKDEIAGPEATAVEVYPPASEVIDEADMYHIWVLPAPVPFSLNPQSKR